MKKKLKKIKKYVAKFYATNKLFLSFVIISLIASMLCRGITVGNAFSYKPIILDLAMILIIGAFGYFVKPKRQFYYFFGWLTIFCLIDFINSIYYVFYQSFSSFSLLTELGQVGDVGDSVTEKLSIEQFIFFLFPFIFYYIHRILNKGNYYAFVTKVEKAKKMFLSIAVISFILVIITIAQMKSADYSRIIKQWDRSYLVERFGITFYQGNDLIQSITPKINTLFGYDEAVNNFLDFYNNKENTWQENKYTNEYKDKNVVFIHMESIQTFLMDLEFNGEKATPNLNKLAEDGIFFSNFYPEIGVGTSSDTEFTLTTSLMPALSGTVFVSYSDRCFESIPNILSNQGYRTFSMHGNKGSMWNREVMHHNLGYQKLYFEDSFNIDETVGLGLSDVSFFKQAITKLEKIEQNNSKYMGTLITLSNHSPFEDLEHYLDYDLTFKRTEVNEETGESNEVIDKYLDGTKMGNYIKSAHYADYALGEFMRMIKESDSFDNTIFVFYGDHEARIAKSEFNYLYNYDTMTGEMKSKDDPTYVKYDYYAQELNNKTPLIIWTKDSNNLPDYDYYMGMIDVLPTIGNMVGFSNPYALGNDIFSVKDENIVMFPNGNFLTNSVYYNNSKEEYIALNSEPISEDYINYCKEYTEKRLNVSNDIIVFDLEKKDKEGLFKGDVE